MELIDRYLQAVATWLPRAQQDDILRELSENIRSDVEEREAELARPLNTGEEAALLKQYGHPMLFAARYRRSRSLIGPALLPLYWLAINIALAVTAFFWVLSLGGLIASGRPASEIAAAPLAFLHAALPAVGWVTLIFAVAEFFSERLRLPERFERWNQEWDPKTLAPIKRERLVRRRDSITGLVINLGLGAWTFIAIFYPQVVWGKLPFRFASVWQELVWPIVALFLVGIAQNCISLARPAWTWLPSAGRIVTTLIAVAIAYRLVAAHEIIIGAGNLAGYDRVLAIVNSSILISLGISITICVPLVALQALVAVRDVLRSRGGRSVSGVVVG